MTRGRIDILNARDLGPTKGPGVTADEHRFERRRGRGKRTISLTCPECGYKQYDLKATSRRGSAAIVDCARCGYEGEVVEVKTDV